MRLFVTILFAVASVTTAQQQQLDPAYLRQYYSQIGQQQPQGRSAAPIFEQQQEPQHYGQQQPTRNYPRPVTQATQIYVPEQQQARQYQPQPQPQQIQYQQPKAQQQQQPRPKKPAFNLQQEEDKEDYDPNPSYSFGFDVRDEEFTNYQNRKESRDGGIIKGSYSVVDSDGFIRTVSYTADPKEGFKAEVVREPTDIVIKVPTPAPQKSNEPQQQIFRQAQPKQQQPQQQYVQQQPRPQQQQQQQYRQEYYQQ